MSRPPRKLWIALVVIDLVVAGGVLYVTLASRGELTFSFPASTVTTTVFQPQPLPVQLNVSSVSCLSENRTCSVLVSNGGSQGAQVTACVFQLYEGGIGTLGNETEVPGHTNAVIECVAPAGMTGVAQGDRVLAAFFLLRGTPLPWSGVWQ
jgi:hypothetical protein